MRHDADTADSTAIAPHADYGIFGPDSVAWRVFSYPTATTVAFVRTVAVEVLEPYVLASVTDTRSVLSRPKLRYDRTLQYTATVVFADSASVVKAADTLLRIHRRIVGPEPLGGGRYDAYDPRGQLWIHLTEWHSVLYAYERFGPGKLSPADELRYWAECRRAAAFQTIDPDDVPRTRDEVRAYFATMRPRLTDGAVARLTVQVILDTVRALIDEVPGVPRPARAVIAAALRAATVSTLPRWLRGVAGVRQGSAVDALIAPLMRVAFALADRSPALQLAVLRRTSPLAYPVIAPVLLGLPPRSPATVDPAEAWRRAGRPEPREQYREQIAGAPPARPGPTPDADLLPFA